VHIGADNIMQSILDDVVRAGFAISKGFDIKRFIASLTEQLFDITGSHLACFYSAEEYRARLLYRRGRYDIPETFSTDRDPFNFVLESGETVVLTKRKPSPFLPLLLHSSMHSGIIAPIKSERKIYAFVILNSAQPEFFTRTRLRFAEAITKLAGEYFHNTILHNRLRDYTRKIQSLELYQKNIFTSMSNLLITTDTTGTVQYFNRAAALRFQLTGEHIGTNVLEIFKTGMGKKMQDLLTASIREGTGIVAAEGIYRNETGEMDFSLTASPLFSRGNKLEGMTLIFTDQSKERELEKTVRTVKEERRLIKDMFSRYVSREIASRIVAHPDLIHLGGDKRDATVLFADIRGYTSFSEGRDPEYIIKVLNEYFSEAVEIVLKHHGYIDKFIGDCIMAAWGIPLKTETEDARLAVSCALEIQNMVKDPQRSFFKGEAKKLAIGIGIHTGPLVAGNIGSAQRVDYTIIGDTVNVAARLEGVAGPGEVVITEYTRNHLGRDFRVTKKPPVQVKGKSRPLQIYRVLKKVG
jgi:adenylate cyclase